MLSITSCDACAAALVLQIMRCMRWVARSRSGVERGECLPLPIDACALLSAFGDVDEGEVVYSLKLRDLNSSARVIVSDGSRLDCKSVELTGVATTEVRWTPGCVRWRYFC